MVGVFPNLSKDSQPGSTCDVYYINHIVFKFLIKSLIFALDLLTKHWIRKGFQKSKNVE